VRRRAVLSGLTASVAAAALPQRDEAATPAASLAELLSAEAMSAAPMARETLTQRLASARRLFSTSRYDEPTGHLVALIAGAAATRRDGASVDREAVTVILAAGYRLASALEAKASAVSGNPTTFASGRRHSARGRAGRGPRPGQPCAAAGAKVCAVGGPAQRAGADRGSWTHGWPTSMVPAGSVSKERNDRYGSVNHDADPQTALGGGFRGTRQLSTCLPFWRRP
jgi:hypothetical protein